jgi:hypothetical protein
VLVDDIHPDACREPLWMTVSAELMNVEKKCDKTQTLYVGARRRR